MTDTVPLDVVLTIQTTQNRSFPFYIQIQHRSTVLTILIVSPPSLPQKKTTDVDTPCIQSCSLKFFLLFIFYLKKFICNFYLQVFHHYVHRTEISLVHNLSKI